MVKKRKLGRGVAVVGAGMSKFGMFRDKDSKDVFAEAFNDMLASVDKGVDPNEIDALYLGNFTNDFFIHQSHWGPIVSDLIGHTPRPATRTAGSTCFSPVCLQRYRRGTARAGRVMITIELMPAPRLSNNAASHRRQGWGSSI